MSTPTWAKCAPYDCCEKSLTVRPGWISPSASTPAPTRSVSRMDFSFDAMLPLAKRAVCESMLAIRASFSRSALQASNRAEPELPAPHEPPEPAACGKLVSPSSTRTRSIRIQSDIGLGKLKRVAARRRGLSHSHQPASVTNLARLRIALVPSKSTRSFLHAGDQMTAGIGNMLLRIFRRLVAHTQFDRVEVELFGKFVHRAFQRHQPDRLARRAHRRCNRNIQWCQTMSRQPVWSGVKRTGLQRRALVGLLAG